MKKFVLYLLALCVIALSFAPHAFAVSPSASLSVSISSPTAQPTEFVRWTLGYASSPDYPFRIPQTDPLVVDSFNPVLDCSSGTFQIDEYYITAAEQKLVHVTKVLNGPEDDKAFIVKYQYKIVTATPCITTSETPSSSPSATPSQSTVNTICPSDLIYSFKVHHCILSHTSHPSKPSKTASVTHNKPVVAKTTTHTTATPSVVPTPVALKKTLANTGAWQVVGITALGLFCVCAGTFLVYNFRVVKKH